jgi:hypothetical protein
MLEEVLKLQRGHAPDLQTLSPPHSEASGWVVADILRTVEGAPIHARLCFKNSKRDQLNIVLVAPQHEYSDAAFSSIVASFNEG